MHLCRPQGRPPRGRPAGDVPGGRPAGDVPRGRLIPGVDFPFEVKKAYIDKHGRIINPNDCDGDSLPDDWEMRCYGTLKYGSRARFDVVRLDRPPWKPDPQDTDEDSLPDKWEMKYFGHLRYDQYDDPDEDGWPNHMEYSNQKTRSAFDPTQIDLKNPEDRPKRYFPYNKRTFNTLTEVFWRKQDAARQKLLTEGGQALVEARMTKRSRRPTTRAATAASTRPSG